MSGGGGGGGVKCHSVHVQGSVCFDWVHGDVKIQEKQRSKFKLIGSVREFWDNWQYKFFDKCH